MIATLLRLWAVLLFGAVAFLLSLCICRCAQQLLQQCALA